MAIEVITRTGGDDSPPQTQMVSRLALGETTEVTLGASAPQLNGYSKQGGDLQLQFSDGQSLVVENFFVLGDEGQFNRLNSEDGMTIVTGLVAPEPKPEDVSAFTGMGDAMDSSAAPQDPSSDASSSSAASQSNLSDLLASGSLAVPAAVFAAGYGGGNLLSDDERTLAKMQDENPSAKTDMSEVSDLDIAMLISDDIADVAHDTDNQQDSMTDTMRAPNMPQQEANAFFIGGASADSDPLVSGMMADLAHESDL